MKMYGVTGCRRSMTLRAGDAAIGDRSRPYPARFTDRKQNRFGSPGCRRTFFRFLCADRLADSLWKSRQAKQLSMAMQEAPQRAGERQNLPQLFVARFGAGADLVALPKSGSAAIRPSPASSSNSFAQFSVTAAMRLMGPLIAVTPSGFRF